MSVLSPLFSLLPSLRPSLPPSHSPSHPQNTLVRRKYSRGRAGNSLSTASAFPTYKAGRQDREKSKNRDGQIKQLSLCLQLLTKQCLFFCLFVLGQAEIKPRPCTGKANALKLGYNPQLQERQVREGGEGSRASRQSQPGHSLQPAAANSLKLPAPTMGVLACTPQGPRPSTRQACNYTRIKKYH